MAEHKGVGVAEKRAMLEAAGEPWPVCDCHGEPKGWHKNAQRKAGGYWRCAVGQHENERRWRAANPEANCESSRKWQEANLVRKSMYDMKYKLAKQLERDEKRLAEVLKGRRA